MAWETTIINKFGKMAGWNDLTINMLGRDVEGVYEFAYDDNVDIEAIKGAGGEDIGYGEGNYTAKASITLYTEEWNAIQRSLPPGKHISQIAPFSITAEYEYEGFKIKDRIPFVKIKGRGVEVKQGDKVIGYKAELVVIGRIFWNV